MLLYPLLRAGVKGKDVGDSLDGLNNGPNGAFTTFVTEPARLPSSTAVLKLRIKAKSNGESHAIYVDNIRITGKPKFVDSYDGFITARTDWFRGDERRLATADPDGDGLPNLLEYAFLTEPDHEGSGPSRLPNFTINADGTFSFSFFRRGSKINPAPDGGFEIDDLVYILQVSLGDRNASGKLIWLSSFEDLFELQPTIEPTEEEGLVRVSLRSNDAVRGGQNRVLFMRLAIQMED